MCWFLCFFFGLGSPRSQTPSLGHLHSGSNGGSSSSGSGSSGSGSGVIDITDEAQATVHQESSEAVSALLAAQKAESTSLSPYLPLNPSPVSSPPVPPSPSPSEGGRRVDLEPPLQPQGIVGGGGVTTAGTRILSKIEFAPSDVIR